MLADLVDKDNNNAPKAGIRIVVPPHLKDTERQLSDYGRRLRNRHGKGTKTHVKFDGGEKSIFLNVKLKEDKYWSRVYPEFARDWLKRMKNNEAEKLNRRFNISPADENCFERRLEQRYEAGQRPRSLAWNGHASK